MRAPLVTRVAAVLDELDIPHALVGAGALAVHGVARSTFDLDLFTTIPAVLDPAAWRGLAAGADVRVTIRRGDAEDPLLGVIRFEAEGERDVDIVVGRPGWQSEIPTRALHVTVAGSELPVATAADLILLKLYAGGGQDAWDIEQLLAAPDRHTLVQEVEERIDRLPAAAVRLWRRILGS
jgi:hypothetical protein